MALSIQISTYLNRTGTYLELLQAMQIQIRPYQVLSPLLCIQSIHRGLFGALFALFLMACPISKAQAIQMDSSLPANFRSFLQQALQQLSQVESNGKASPLHHQVFGGEISGRVYLKWLKARIKRIVLVEKDCGFTAKIDSEKEFGVVYVSACVDLNPGPEKTFYWLSILIHEARHWEPQNNYWRHHLTLDHLAHPLPVDRSPLAPFGVEKIFAGNIMRHCSNCHPEFLRQAQEVYEDPLVWQKLEVPGTEW